MTEKLPDEWAFTFGKYKGRTIADIAKKDPDYICWCYFNVEWFEPVKETLHAAAALANKRQREKDEAWAWGSNLKGDHADYGFDAY